VSYISTGREGFDSPKGSFQVLDKDADHFSSIYGDYVDSSGQVVQKDVDRKKDPLPTGCKFEGAKMPYFMRFTGGVGMHQGFLPGYAASHGCIRMPEFMARKFFENVSKGTPVRVVE
jgi:lipoprotein-anchoring transpeptidase ErfK/SrfK